MWSVFQGQIWGLLGWQDVRQAYRRSTLGPFWITIGMAVQIATIGIVFGTIFNTEISDYLPFLATSIILWNFISNSITEGCNAFIASEPMIKQLKLAHFNFVLRVVWKNLVTTGHNLIILPFVFLIFWTTPNLSWAAFVPGAIILTLNLIWCVWLLAIVSARFRDFPIIMSSVMAIAFYLTPVMWYPQLIENNQVVHLLLGLNPLYHWMQIVRLPLISQSPTWENWALSLLSAGVGWLVTLVVYRKFRNMIAYWV